MGANRVDMSALARAGGERSRRQYMERSLAAILAAAATISLASLVVPHWAKVSDLTIAVAACMAYPAAGVLWLSGGRLPSPVSESRRAKARTSADSRPTAMPVATTMLATNSHSDAAVRSWTRPRKTP